MGGNGNLLNDGNRSYAYDDLDRLIQVTQGITSTQYGYTGDGDRLWQQTDGVTTTFTLDLNGALAQVLAQSQGSALTTVNFLPGIGQQQSGGYWTYFHADALGSVRDLSGVTGNAIGHVDYSPFGEIVNSTGMTSWFGFTGEQQDSTSGLTYLRARYYDPAMGRFLTPDSLIPDIINGQALNAYAYVYNDPVNLVDPSGHYIEIPDWVPNGQSLEWTLNNPGKAVTYGIRDAINNKLQIELRVIDWWYSEPDNCECGHLSDAQKDGLYGVNQLFQLAVNGKTAPKGYNYSATITGGWADTIAGTRSNYNVTKWGAMGPVNDARYIVTSLDDGYRVTNAGGVAFMNVQNLQKGLQGSLLNNLNPLLLSGFIDAGFQLFEDSFKCLSPDNMFWRGLVALELGLIAALVGFGVAYSLPITGTTFGIVATGVGIFVGLGFTDYIKIKNVSLKDWLLNTATIDRSHGGK